MPLYYGRGQIAGSATNDNANAGNVGQEVIATVTSGSPISLVNATAKTITSISLTAGDWDVTENTILTPAASANITTAFASISQTDNTLDIAAGKFTQLSNASAGVVPSGNVGQVVPPTRISLAATTTIYMVANVSFTVGTMTAWGSLRARRVR